MKKSILMTILVVLATCAFNTNAASMNCTVDVDRPQGQSIGSNGSCFGFDYSFDNSTNVTFTISPDGDTILDVIWIEGCSASNGSMSCTTVLPAYRNRTARAIVILPPGDRFQQVSASAMYESGY